MLARKIVEVLVAVLLLISDSAEARDPKAVREFKRENPCPSTGKNRGKCPNWIIDHIVPLCAGGADHPANMQWQTVEDSREKDKEEKRLCRDLRRAHRL